MFSDVLGAGVRQPALFLHELPVRVVLAGAAARRYLRDVAASIPYPKSTTRDKAYKLKQLGLVSVRYVKQKSRGRPLAQLYLSADNRKQLQKIGA